MKIPSRLKLNHKFRRLYSSGRVSGSRLFGGVLPPERKARGRTGWADRGDQAVGKAVVPQPDPPPHREPTGSMRGSRWGYDIVVVARVRAPLAPLSGRSERQLLKTMDKLGLFGGERMKGSPFGLIPLLPRANISRCVPCCRFIFPTCSAYAPGAVGGTVQGSWLTPDFEMSSPFLRGRRASSMTPVP